LVCVGKRPRTPVIMTYDPYVSSPFMSPSCNPHPMNPNTKWFINITSVTDIRLLPSCKAARCFPYTDASRALSIETNDGRHLVLRASKDTELERWYFVLFKIWEFQQQLNKAIPCAEQPPHPSPPNIHQPNDASIQKNTQENTLQNPQHNIQQSPQQNIQQNTQHTIQQHPSTSQLAAHQQSEQLFQKYLQKQHQQTNEKQEHDIPLQPQPQPELQHQHQQQQKQKQQHEQQQKPHVLPSQKMLRPPMLKESLHRYQIPAPARVSAFSPQEFDWSLQEQGHEDDLPVGLKSSYRDSPLMRMERDIPFTRHASYNQPVSGSTGSMHPPLVRTVSASGGMVYQRSGVTAASNMEPGKAAIIDLWRRSLMSPVIIEETLMAHSEDTGRNANDKKHEAVCDSKDVSDDYEPLGQADHKRAESRDMETTLRHKSHEFELVVSGIDPNDSFKHRSTWYCENEEQKHQTCMEDGPGMTGKSDLYSRLPYGQTRTFHGQQRSSFLPGMTAQNGNEADECVPLGLKLHQSNQVFQEPSVQQLTYCCNSRTTEHRGEEDELPLALIQVNRHSRWLNTQISSDDGASATQLDTHAAEQQPRLLLPSGCITPETKPRQTHEEDMELEMRIAIEIEPELELEKDDKEVEHRHQNDNFDRLTPPRSNPSLSLHGSSYSHLPIHDPEFVFPLSASTPACEQTSLSSSNTFPSTNLASQAPIVSSSPPARPPRPNLDMDLTAFSNDATFVITTSVKSLPNDHSLRSKQSLGTKSGCKAGKGDVHLATPLRSLSSSSACMTIDQTMVSSSHPRAHPPGSQKKEHDLFQGLHGHEDNDDDEDADDEQPLVNALSRQRVERWQQKNDPGLYPQKLGSTGGKGAGQHRLGLHERQREQTTPPLLDESFQYF
ncbi:hypothetical protein BG004_003410, partial [Podila humilis]